MRIVLVGDVHREFGLLQRFLARAKFLFRASAAIQLGDFGFRREGLGELYLPIPTYVLDGNHDDQEWLAEECANGNSRRWEKQHNLIFVPRASLLSLGGSWIGALGGATHVDRPQVTNETLGTANFILAPELERAISVFNGQRPLDLIVTHSCPSSIGVGMRAAAGLAGGVSVHVRQAGFDPGPPEDCGDRQLTELWRNLSAKPLAWAFGHFHRFQERVVDQTRFVCCPAIIDDHCTPVVIWDTETKDLCTMQFHLDSV